MLLNKFEMPLDLVVNDSKILRLYFNIIFFLSFISILISGLSLSVKLILCVGLLCLIFLFIKNKSKNKITSLKLNSDEGWGLVIDNKQHYDVTLQGECIVTFFIVWLNFTTTSRSNKNKRFHILLLPDSAEKDLLRRLRVRLRFFKNKKTEDEESILRD